eukprot:CAMPEP_0185490686 /NCGR_PEP_ID=MMETSP1366-20130426/14135_1 /TAXON_ID=38817 /ORGANISM="Gephyrocapsa oceanica, Strain RCC1303" /LENGTH=63 /DNA_ID=CAMNT_0028099387 /DNA_START=125 /DNA_END=313 /DNA_ORIENTATION=+
MSETRGCVQHGRQPAGGWASKSLADGRQPTQPQASLESAHAPRRGGAAFWLAAVTVWVGSISG